MSPQPDEGEVFGEVHSAIDHSNCKTEKEKHTEVSEGILRTAPFKHLMS
jgi:hypothetical protein